MKKAIKITSKIILGIATVFTLTAGRVLALSGAREGAEAARGDEMPAELVGPNGIFTNVTNTILYIVGAVSVIMLVYGGFRYIVSGGDSKKVTDAKNTILYAIIGLIISFLAYAIVHFIINAISGNTPSA